MKWYIALNEEGTEGDIALHTRLAVLSAIKNTRLEPHLLYSGRRNGFTVWMERNGVKVISSRLPYLDAILDLVRRGRYTTATIGHWLRTNVCLVEQTDEFILYTDVDVLFCKAPDLDGIRPDYFSSAPEFKRNSWNYFNAGVMVMNVPGLRREYSKFEEYLVSSLYAKTYDFHDQIAYNNFYRGRWDRLPVELNWKPYWGINESACLVHFHGPKIGAIEAVIAGTWDWSSNHGRQIGSLFGSFLEAYRYYIRLIAHHTSGLAEQDVARIANLVTAVDEYDGRLNGEIDLSFTDFRMYADTYSPVGR
jgi:hypothetical protein